MNFGKFDRLVTLLKPAAPMQNSYGEEGPVRYVEVAKIWAEQKYTPGNEAYQAEQLTAVQPIIWQMRYRADLTTTWLLTYQGTTYEITAAAEIGRRAGLTLTTHNRPALPVVTVPVVAAGGFPYTIPFVLA
ncbi:MAG: phage head closure protein [Janthinobacterium lividum]